MTTALPYLIKDEIDFELSKTVYNHFKVLSEFEGKTCKKCGVVQGASLNGWYKYYCEHISQKVKKITKKENEKSLTKVLSFAVATDALQTLQNSP